MLNALRKNANSWFMILVFAIITIVFVFTFGSWGGQNVSGDLPMAAIVNGQVIPQAQFNADYGNAFRRNQQYRPGYNLEQAKQENLKQQVLDRLIGVELLAQAGIRRGLTVSDEDVVERIKEVYFRSQDFDREDYRRLAQGQFNASEAAFEEQEKRRMLAERMERILRESQRVSPAELQEAFDIKYNRVNLEVLRIDPNHFSKADKPSDAAVAAWAKDHEQEIADHYNNFINRYRVKKQVKARHILIKVAADAPDADKKKAKERIDAALARVKDKGEDFAAVAKELSEDGSAAQGGDLGMFGPGRMVKPFEDAAFALEAGQISDVVETRFGYHVIKVEEVKPEEIRELDEVRNEIAASLMKDSLKKDKALAWGKEAIEQLKAGTAMTDVKLSGFAGNLNEPSSDAPAAPRVEETGWFNQGARYVPRVGISQEVVATAFGLTEDNPIVGEPQEVAGRIYVFKLKERERPDESKFADEKETLEQDLLSLRTPVVVQSFVDQLKESAKIEENPNVLSYGRM